MLTSLLGGSYFVNKLYISLLALIAEHDKEMEPVLQRMKGNQRAVKKFVCDYIRKSTTNVRSS